MKLKATEGITPELTEGIQGEFIIHSKNGCIAFVLLYAVSWSITKVNNLAVFVSPPTIISI